MNRQAKAMSAFTLGRKSALALALAAIVILFVVPSAQAAKGVVNFFGSTGTLGGQFSATTGVGGVAVNANGAGGANAGDIYAVDRGNNRIQRFSAAGEFISAWGRDVVTGGATGFEVCVVAANCKAAAASTGLGGEMTLPQGVAVNQTTGDVYVTEQTGLRVQQFSATGTFIRAWGQDVVQSTKPEDKPATAAKQTLTVDASAGSYKLSFQGKTTSDVAFDATAATVQSALRELSSITAAGVTVTGGPGAAGGGTPYVITFAGPLANSPQPLIATSPGTTPLSGGAGTANVVNTTAGSSGFEVCATAANCKAGVTGNTAGAFATTFAGYPAVAPAGAPNSGNVLVPDPGNRRVQEFTSSGAFVRAFGWDVVSMGPGESVTEVQTLTVNADGGTFTLSFNPGPGSQATGSLKFDATAAEVEAALNGLTNVVAVGGKVSVSGGPGDATGSSPYTITFGGALAGDNVNQITSNAAGLTLSSGVRSATISTTISGGGFEVCAASAFDICKVAGEAGAGDGRFAASTPSRIAEDAAGNIYTVEPTTNFRVQKFTLPGNVPTPQGAFAEAITKGTSSEGAAQNNPTDVVVDSVSGDVFVVKAVPKGLGVPAAAAAERRVLEISPAGALLDTHIANSRVTTANGLALDPATDQLLLTSTTEAQRVLVLGVVPASAEETFSAEIDDPAATAITTEGATVHGVINPSLGILAPTRYRFEYTNGSTWVQAPLREAGNGSGAGDPGSCPIGNPPICNVSESLTLEPGQNYKVRIRAFVSFNPELLIVTPPVKFSTLGVPPTAKTGSAWWSSPAETTPNLIMTGFVNPKNEATTFYFEYVTEEQFTESGFEGAATAPTPAPPGDPSAKSFDTVEVQQAVYELDPSKAYRYRLVTINPSGTVFGADRTIDPPSADGRFYELVSNGDSGGLGVLNIEVISDQGSRLLFNSQIFDDPRGATGLFTPKVAERTANGWKATTMVPSPDRAKPKLAHEFQPAADLSTFLYETKSTPEEHGGAVTYLYGGLDESLSPASPLLQPLTSEPGVTTGVQGRFINYSVYGLSADLSHYLLAVEGITGGLGGVTMTTGEPLIPKRNLYEVNGKTLQLSLVNRDSAGNQIGGVCGTGLGGNTTFFGGIAAKAMSLDGSVVYFNARPGTPYSGPCDAAVEAEFPRRIFKRENGETTTEVSASQCNRPALPAPPGPCKAIVGDDTYLRASDDGSVVFFSSPRQLTNSDVDSAVDLYAYDSSPPAGQPTLVQVTAGEVTPGHPTIGSGAEYVGLVDTSSDGSRVYFVAKGQLSSGATAGQNNLYVYQRDAAHPSGRIDFIATLASAGDSSLWGVGKQAYALPSASIAFDGEQTYGSGSYLVFVSSAQLSAEDTDSVGDLYRYADETGQMLCLSCVGDEAKPVSIVTQPVDISSKAAASQEGRVATEDVDAAVFSTTEALLPADQNSVADAYMWDEDELALISSDTGEQGIKDRPWISLDGTDVYFMTDARLVPSDVDFDLATDVYDARTGGGFPAPKPAARICIDSEICRGPTSSAPPLAGSASASTVGPGNQTSKSAKPRCRKGKVRRRGRCVKPKNQKHAKKRGGRKAGAKKARGSK